MIPFNLTPSPPWKLSLGHTCPQTHDHSIPLRKCPFSPCPQDRDHQPPVVVSVRIPSIPRSWPVEPTPALTSPRPTESRHTANLQRLFTDEGALVFTQGPGRGSVSLLTKICCSYFKVQGLGGGRKFTYRDWIYCFIDFFDASYILHPRVSVF